MIYRVSYKRFPKKVCCLPSIKLHDKLFLWKFIEKYFDFLRDIVNSGSSKKVFSGSALMHGAQPHSTIQNVAIDCLTQDRCLDARLSSQLLLCHISLLQLIFYHFTGVSGYKRCKITYCFTTSFANLRYWKYNKLFEKFANLLIVFLQKQGLVRDRVGKIYSSGFILSQNSVSVKLLLVFVYTIFIIIFSSSMNS